MSTAQAARLDCLAHQPHIALLKEEQRIVDMLAAKKTMPDIGKALGQHRSMIWRKVQKIKVRLGP